jgi:predicted RecB family nuclease
MQPSWNILQAKPYCSYKAWQLAKSNNDLSNLQDLVTEKDLLIKLPGKEAEFTINTGKITPKDKLAVAARCYLYEETTGNNIEIAKINYGTDASIKNSSTIRTKRYSKQAQKLLTETSQVINNDTPPAFYRNSHCSECQFWSTCYKKLKERDCISLLGGISPKILKKYHSRGFFSITQLSHTFRPRRRRRGRPQPSGNFLWELKALAIREQKTFVMHPPDLINSTKSIYIDFEGLPDEGRVYLIGGILKEEGKPDECFSYWADDRKSEEQILCNLLSFLKEYPDAPIYHYGSYETTALKHISRKLSGSLKKELNEIESRMVNLLGYLRTHVYPPTYSNGLKEVAGFLGFKWKETEADGKHSILWRKEWEVTGAATLKERLLEYNQDDCIALSILKEWFNRLTPDTKQANVQQVSEMKKHSPFKFQDNPEFGEDYKIISRASYFDYQHRKIYWRNNRKSPSGDSSISLRFLHRPGKGKPFWKPKKANEVIIAPPLKKCKRCGSTKLYILGEKNKIFRQTDLKFTVSGIKRHIIEYRTGKVKCAKCTLNQINRSIRTLHYGDNLFAWAMNLYVKYHLSHEMISRMLLEQFGIWMNPMYLVQRKYKWLKRWKPEVQYIWEIIRHSPVIHIDETSVRLSKDKGYVWVFATPHTVFYHFTFSRESDFLAEWLKDYTGIIVTDFFPGYETLKVKRQECLVHLIRDLNDELFKNPFDEEYKAIVTAFGKMLRKIIETIDKYGLKKSHLEKHVKDTEHFFKEFVECEHKGELSIKCVKRLRKHWDMLWTFLHYDGVPWNNNNAEAAIKAFAKHRRMVNGQMNERGIREYLEMLSIEQSCRNRKLSFLGFLRGKVGIWENIDSQALPGYLPFNQARLYTHKLNFERKREWLTWESKENPGFIPHTPNSAYKKHGWVGWQDWIGFSFLPFEKARTFMRKLGLRNRDEYWAWQRSGKRPKSIPACPEIIYKYTGWKDLGDWLGTGNSGRQPKKKMTYLQAKAYVQALGIKTQKEFFEWRKSGQRPDTLPSDAARVYFEFEGWGKFLGTDRVANQDKKYWDYERAKRFLSPLNITSEKHFRQLYSEGIISDKIPKKPYSYYKKQGTWLGFPDFFNSTL